MREASPRKKSAPAGRRLATILAADAVGYSRLMHADEEGTVATLQANRAVIDESIVRHGGRIFGTAGDSVVAEFGSAIEAVRCSVEIQEEMTARNVDMPEDRRMRFRIGIDVGDVIVDGDNLLGDGVNVAARLEGLAEAGGVCVSGSVFDQVRGKISVSFQAMGPQKVKNIADAVLVYRVKLDLPGAGFSPEQHGWANGGRPSIAVLAFSSMGGGSDDEQFGNGIAEDILTALTRFPGLHVIARNSSFRYRGKDVDIGQVGRELGARYVLEGSVRHAKDTVRVTAQLINALDNTHLWAERYDRPASDIFAAQDDITERVAAGLIASIRRTEMDRVAQKATESLEAWELVLRARHLLQAHDLAPTLEARRLLERAAEIDPNYAPAYAWASYAYSQLRNMPGTAEYLAQENLVRSEALADKATALNGTFAAARSRHAVSLMFLGKHRVAEAEAGRALGLNSHDIDVLRTVAVVRHWLGDSEGALQLIGRAQELDPYFSVSGMQNMASILYTLGRFPEAASEAESCLRRVPHNQTCVFILAAALAQLGQESRAAQVVADLVRINPGFSLSEYQRLAVYWKDARDRERVATGLRKAGVRE